MLKVLIIINILGEVVVDNFDKIYTCSIYGIEIAPNPKDKLRVRILSLLTLFTLLSKFYRNGTTQSIYGWSLMSSTDYLWVRINFLRKTQAY